MVASNVAIMNNDRMINDENSGIPKLCFVIPQATNLNNCLNDNTSES